MSLGKTTYLLYGLALDIGEDDLIAGTPGPRSIWEDDDLQPYLHGQAGYACSLLYGERPPGRAYFGLVLASTSGCLETTEHNLGKYFSNLSQVELKLFDQARKEIRWFAGSEAEAGLWLVDTIS